jgi:hypothetical protein
MQNRFMQLLQLMQFWRIESFSVSLTNKIIGSDVIINQDSIDGYEGLGFDMSIFNQDGLGDLFTIGISNLHGPVSRLFFVVKILPSPISL